MIIRFVTILSLVMACSPKVKLPSEVNDIPSVEIEKSKPRPQILTEDQNPLFSRRAGNKAPSQKNLIIALVFEPALYRASCYLGALKALEAEKLSFHVVSGWGSGAIIAGLVAKYSTISRAEWDYYKFLQQTWTKEKIFSSSWNDGVQDWLKDNFNARFREANDRLLMIPSSLFVDENDEKMRLEVSTKLERIALADNSVLERLLAEDNTQVVSLPQFLKQHGVDKVIGISAIGKDLKFLQGSGMMVGRIKKIQALAHKVRPQYDYMIDLACDETPVDSLENHAQLLKWGYARTKKIIPMLQEKLKTN